MRQPLKCIGICSEAMTKKGSLLNNKFQSCLTCTTKHSRNDKILQLGSRRQEIGQWLWHSLHNVCFQCDQKKIAKYLKKVAKK